MHGFLGVSVRRVLFHAKATEVEQTTEHEVCCARSKRSCLFGLLLADVVSPGPECLHDLGEDGCGEWYPDEDEGLVDNVCEAELRPDCCNMF